jgi:hypothetical protein
MALVQSTLRDALRDLFVAPGPTEVDCRFSWRAAMITYATPITPPSTAVTAAGNALALGLAGFNAPGAAAGKLESAFATFAATLAAGMAPAFVGVPPPGIVGFVSQFAGAMPATHLAAADALATLIDTWMRTGTALTQPGGVPVVPWS